MIWLPVILLSTSFFCANNATALPARPNRPITPRADLDKQKTWTNLDIPFLRENAPISIVGDTGGSEPDSASNKTAPAVPGDNLFELQESNPHWYAAQMQMLRERIDADEDQIRNILEIRQTGEGITGAIPLDKTAPGLSPEATMQILQGDQNSIRAEMDELEDLARMNGIDPGVLR
ncbi:MAG: hypothetical protein WB630_11500 [Candidatus Acidiferrales bacterium]